VWVVVAIVGANVAVVAEAVAPAFAFTLAGALAVGAVAVPPLRYRRWRYEIRSRDLLMSRGALFFKLTLVPFDRIQFVESRQGPLDRVFGLSQLVVYTAAGTAGQIPGLAPGEAESLREELSRVAGTSTV
jgi:uncharacterized protein